MYFGLVELEGTAALWVLTHPGTRVPTAPTAAPTATIYEGGATAPIANGSAVTMTGTVDSKTGFYRLSHSIAAADGYERGKTYLVKFEWAISGTSYSEEGTFTVV